MAAETEAQGPEAHGARDRGETAHPRRPMRADARRNYERLVEVATESFLANGANASLDDIAKRAGVGPGTLYRHFPTRQDLFDAVAARWSESVGAEAETFLHAEDPGMALHEWLVKLIAQIGEFRGLAAALLLTDNRKHETVGVLGETLEQLLARAQASGQVRTDVEAHEVMQLASGVSYTCSAAKTMKKRTSSPDRLVGLIMDGLRAE
ncbi:TetR/AcrR family transcriptional regulator [Streptacidiphilus fuscans]|uniref:TetR/AcrR family transcriptional regulator n=1 Tax=Streptacidiphilus fuscans TaxID=2789292 RepID=A0A931B4D7_9ACTN|nr:TetR/AcrR family transcriptional regulator [Streptacidiphilus fuscans]MBF9071005.1 TetR/AcrR family transcriptional regulator [Streptacidiphilus fuscans]